MSPGQPRRRGPVSPRRARPTHRRPRLPRLGPATRSREHRLRRPPRAARAFAVAPPPSPPHRARATCLLHRRLRTPSLPAPAVDPSLPRRHPSSGLLHAQLWQVLRIPVQVGFIIGKAGETVKYLQAQSGAKIQVTGDMDVQPGSQTRSVDLSGTPDQINRAEELIIGVLAEADARSSGTISNRKYNAAQPGAEQFQMQISNNKVIPLHLPPGDTSTERTLYIDGTAQQIEIAK
ncbi:far upstream element-binding protein 3-like [Triticum aestivum]|uniref:far upstream element-binding protein 3-like n=1 Tax=Triticum aestivum TaxID=4565 RepID=UPI001D0239F1|nr:far upstream element-binding protein 3-like [Triticum aestivum]